jgi:hypothetical protein
MTLIENELRRSFDYFWLLANRDENSPAYGLIADNSGRPEVASIASVGFGLSAIAIGVQNSYITYAEGLNAVRKTLKTFAEVIPHFNGFFVHFVKTSTGEPRKNSEYSTIDTAIFLNGAITCDVYFDDPEVHRLFNLIYERVDWNSFMFVYQGKLTFRMAYNPHEGGDYRWHTKDPWIYHWDMFAEQLSMYFLAAGSDTVSAGDAKALFDGFSRKKGCYAGYEYIYAPSNPLFIYQYSHAWVDFGKYLDADGFDWFANSKTATLANREWCLQHQKEYPIFNENMWGITHCLTPLGYRGQGVLPTDDLTQKEGHSTGVIPPSGLAGSIVFTPELVIPALEYIEKTYPTSFGQFGFADGIAVPGEHTIWICPDHIGINKGITVLMLDNYLHQTTWKLYMSHPLIVKAIAKLGFTKR